MKCGKAGDTKMSLINADSLKERYEDRKRLFCKKRIEFSMLSEREKGMADELEHCISDILNAPTVDAVEVIRCKNCRYQDKGENESESWNMCRFRPWSHVPTSDDHFCASGDRKDGDLDDE